MMWLSHIFSLCLSASWALAGPTVYQRNGASSAIGARSATGIAPKVFIISMFTPEYNVWHGIPEFDVLAQNITVPGLSPLYPDVHCTADYEICQLVTGAGEINAATTMTALSFSPVFDLSRTYFLIAGIAGVNPRVATSASVTFARYDVQVALQYEIDPRDLPANWTTGYFPQGADVPSEYPQSIYGTEVFELNDALRQRAIGLVNAANVTLNDSTDAEKYRALYVNSGPGGSDAYIPATKKPQIVACDGVTSDVYFSGTILNEAFENYTRLITNGTGNYCATAQEDNATFEALLRAAVAKRVDFGRIIAMRTCSDFAAPPPGTSNYINLRFAEQGAFEPSLQNIRIAGVPIVQGIVSQWNSTYAAGIKANNYIGDIFDTLGGKMDFGPAMLNDNPVKRGTGYSPMGARGRVSAARGRRSAKLPKMKLNGSRG